MPAQKKCHLKTKSIFPLISSALAVAFILQGCGSKGTESVASSNKKVCVPTSGDLFVEVAPEVQPDVVELGMGRRTLRKREVMVKFDTLKQAIQTGVGGKIRLGLFSGKQFDMVIQSVEKVAEDEAVVVGKISGDESSHVTLVMNEDALVADVHLEGSGEHFEIRYNGDGVHTIRALGADSISGCAAVPAPAQEPPVDLSPETFEVGSASVLATPVVDMLVGYTPNARAAMGGTNGIQALIRMGIADTNRAMADSGVALSVRLVGMLEVTQNETTDFYADLEALRSTTDGKWDILHTVRKRLGADQVSLVGLYAQNYTIAGIGYVNATASSAFTIVRTSAFGMYTFSHELGHNLGLRHEDGLENPVGGFRTIMAYGTYKRIRRFSNPNLPYNGAATGDSTHNSAQVLNANASTKAAMVASVVPFPTPFPTPTPSPTPRPTATPSTNTPLAPPVLASTPSASPTPLLASPGSSNGTENCDL